MIHFNFKTVWSTIEKYFETVDFNSVYTIEIHY